MPDPDADLAQRLADLERALRRAAPPMTAAQRERLARLEELRSLRVRHWSPDSVLDPVRTGLEWWEHPRADPYAVLGLLPGATLEELAAARRRIAAVCHPDVARDDQLATRRMVAANAAFARVRDALLVHD